MGHCDAKKLSIPELLGNILSPHLNPHSEHLLPNQSKKQNKPLQSLTKTNNKQVPKKCKRTHKKVVQFVNANILLADGFYCVSLLTKNTE